MLSLLTLPNVSISLSPSGSCVSWTGVQAAKLPWKPMQKRTCQAIRACKDSIYRNTDYCSISTIIAISSRVENCNSNQHIRNMLTKISYVFRHVCSVLRKTTIHKQPFFHFNCKIVTINPAWPKDKHCVMGKCKRKCNHFPPCFEWLTENIQVLVLRLWFCAGLKTYKHTHTHTHTCKRKKQWFSYVALPPSFCGAECKGGDLGGPDMDRCFSNLRSSGMHDWRRVCVRVCAYACVSMGTSQRSGGLGCPRRVYI